MIGVFDKLFYTFRDLVEDLVEVILPQRGEDIWKAFGISLESFRVIVNELNNCNC